MHEYVDGWAAVAEANTLASGLPASAFQSLPDDFFRLSLAIPVGRVDEIDPRVQGPVDDPDRIVVVGIPTRAEHHRTQTVCADLDASSTQRAVLRFFPPLCR